VTARRELADAIARFRLATARTTLQGLLGERVGRGTGSSMDFADVRDYVPGDDPRRLDWRAYARTDRLQTRLYREEVAPALDVVLDPSASMATTEAKERATRDVLAALETWAPLLGARPKTFLFGGGVLDAPATPTFDFRTEAPEPPRLPLRPRALRFVVSDFLYRGDPAPFLRKLATNAADVVVIQILDPWEAAPEGGEPLTLVDVETGLRRDVRLTDKTAAKYRARLSRLCEGVAAAARSFGGRYARVVAAAPFAMFQGPLLSAGVTEPR
jgi:hypothetical protein